MDDDGNVVLVYQYRHPFASLWELPAGLLDVGGEPPHVTAARELEEEAASPRPTGGCSSTLTRRPGSATRAFRVYLATGLRDVGRPEADDEEADMTVRRVSLDEAVQMVFSGEIVNSLAVGGILAAHCMTDPSSFAIRRRAMDR